MFRVLEEVAPLDASFISHPVADGAGYSMLVSRYPRLVWGSRDILPRAQSDLPVVEVNEDIFLVYDES